ncbi:MAG: hypothetical protein HGA76_01625 [Candidatus Firestonebacteria bacterium]|nr:hypothetical protein [Candidatus Firestonebacteria bacterium]
MRLNNVRSLILFWNLLFCIPTISWAGTWEGDLETGQVNSGYNVVRIPGKTGTQISLPDTFTFRPETFFRFRLFYTFSEDHALGALVAPLSLHGEGESSEAVDFAGQLFPAHTRLKALYRFDSYRLTYRYRFWYEQNANVHIGLTAKIRDAEISLEGNGIKAQKTNVGFVPLLYLRADWNFAHPWGLLLDAEALAAPQGRAEDVLLAVTYQADEHWRFKLGYRFVEGGGDNAEVYSFAAIHYGVVGVTAIY